MRLFNIYSNEGISSSFTSDVELPVSQLGNEYTIHMILKIDNNTSTDTMFIAKGGTGDDVNPEIKFIPGENIN